MAIQIQLRRDTAANWTTANPTLAIGEMGLETDTKKFKIGDGTTAWNSLAYGGIQGTTGSAGSQGSTGTSGAQGTTGAGNLTGFNAQTGTTYTLVAGDVSKLVTANNASAITITVPPSVFNANDQINVQQIGAGQVSFAQGSGVTITSNGATASAPKLRAQYSACTIICTASNTFTIIGDIS
jgi:hypothetical protein